MSLLTSKKKGVSLVEIIVSIFLISSISILMAQLTASSVKTYKVTQLTNKYSESITKIIRDFEFTTRAGIDIEVAKPKDLTFYRYYKDQSETPYPDKVHYFVEKEDGKNKFKIGISEFDRLDPNKNPIYKAEKITLIVDDVKFDSDPETIEKVFDYYNKDDEILDSEVNSDTGVATGVKIQSIGLTVSLGGNPVDPNKITTQSTKIKFRNLNAI